jgi:hypothetical protein
LAHGLKSGVTGQTGDGHQSDQWRAPVRPVVALGRASEPLSVFPTLPR